MDGDSRLVPELHGWGPTTVTADGVVTLERHPNERAVRTELAVLMLELFEEI